MQENLLGYLLGALDGPEHETMQRQLDNDPLLRRQLSELELKLAPLEEERWQHEPPPGLAAATCALVAKHAAKPEANNSVQVVRRRSGLSPAMSEWNPRKHGWDLIDAVVAAGIFLAAGLLFFPAIAQSRYQARLASCQDKLRLNSVALSIFGERNNGVFPYIPTEGKTGVAGFYAPQLMDGGFLTEDSAFLCPSSRMARNRKYLRTPTVDEIRAADGPVLVLLQKTMGGSYMYTLGHFHNGRHRATTNRGRNNFPVMADGLEDFAGGPNGGAHGGRGINVAFEGGHVRFLVHVSRQHPYFVSERGLVEAGTNVEDAVLGHSSARPLAILPAAIPDTPAEPALNPEGGTTIDLSLPKTFEPPDLGQDLNSDSVIQWLSVE